MGINKKISTRIFIISLISIILLSTTAISQNKAITNLEVSVKNIAPYIENKWELPDELPEEPGIQIWPTNITKEVMLCAIACDNNGINDVKKVYAIIRYPNGKQKGEWKTLKIAPLNSPCRFNISINSKICNIYNSSIIMNKSEPAGNYKVNVTVKDKYNLSNSLINEFSWNEILGVEIDEKTISFGQLLPNSNKTIFGDYCFKDNRNSCPAYKPTIMNTGNIPIDVEIKASDLIGPSLIPSSNLFSNINGVEYPLNSTAQFNINLATLDTTYMHTTLHIPPILPGSYKGTISFFAIQST